MGPFFPLEHLENTVGLLIGPISILLCIREYERGQRERERERKRERKREMREGLVGKAVRTYMFVN